MNSGDSLAIISIGLNKILKLTSGLPFEKQIEQIIVKSASYFSVCSEQRLLYIRKIAFWLAYLKLRLNIRRSICVSKAF